MDRGYERALATVQTVNDTPPSLALSDMKTTEFENQDISVVIATMTEAIFLSLIFVASVISNALVFIIFYQRPTLRSLSNRFVLNLALCELLYSLLVIPYVTVAVVTDGAAVSVLWCRLTKVVTVLLALGCVFSILLIAVDRYCAVMNPLHYNMTITRTRCSCMITATWLLSFGFALLPLTSVGGGDHHGHPRPANESRLAAAAAAAASLGVAAAAQCDCWSTVTTVVFPAYRFWYSVAVAGLGFVFPLLLLCWSYACMYRAARDSSVRVRRHSVTLNPSEVILQEALGGSTSSGECTPINQGSGGALLGGSGHHHSHQQHHHHHNLLAFKKTFYRRRSSSASVSVVFFREEGKAAQTGLLVIATYVCCWLPYFAFVLLEAQPNWKSVPTLGRTLAQHLTFVGCALNPFVYVYRNRMVWKDARHLLHCRRTGHFNYTLQRHYPKATPGGGVMHYPLAGCINNNNSHFRHYHHHHHQTLASKEVAIWRHGAAKSLIRIAIDDRESEAAETIRLEALPPILGASVCELEAPPRDDSCSTPEPQRLLAACHTLRVETVHGSCWSLPNQNVSYFVHNDAKSVSDNDVQKRKSPETEDAESPFRWRYGAPAVGLLPAIDVEVCNNNDDNNNDYDEDKNKKNNNKNSNNNIANHCANNNHYDNRVHHYHNRAPSPGNYNHPATFRGHPGGHLAPLTLHPTYHSSTISLLRVNHPTHSASGTTL